jgi:DNA-binding response OmpR family regulator
MQRILLVCSDLVMTDELTFFLRHSGFQVASIIESKQAVAEVARTQPDLILMRENNRRVNGDELCIHIRELSDIPIIVLGHALEQADGVEMLEMGADAYLTSPLNPRELLARIHRLLHRTRRLREIRRGSV